MIRKGRIRQPILENSFVTAAGSFSAEGIVPTPVACIAIAYSPHLYSRGVFAPSWNVFSVSLLDARRTAITTAAAVPHNKNLRCRTRAVQDRGRSRRAHGSRSFDRPRARGRRHPHRDRLSGKNQGQTAISVSKDH